MTKNEDVSSIQPSPCIHLSVQLYDLGTQVYETIWGSRESKSKKEKVRRGVWPDSFPLENLRTVDKVPTNELDFFSCEVGWVHSTTPIPIMVMTHIVVKNRVRDILGLPRTVAVSGLFYPG